MPEKDSILLIKKYIDEYDSVKQFISDNVIYSNSIKLGNSSYNVAGVFFNDNPNLLANYILKNYLYDILFLIDLKNHVVIFRKKEKCEINLGKLAKQLGKGGGNEFIAGCILNQNILNLTKLLKPDNA